MLMHAWLIKKSLVSCGMRPVYTYTSVEYVVTKTGDWDEQQPRLPKLMYKRCPS